MTVSLTQSTSFGEFGLPPHNLSPDEVDTQVSQATGELALLVIKPGFFPTHPEDGSPVQANLEERMAHNGLRILCTAQRSLSPLEVCELYRCVLPPNPADDEKWGTDWKRDLIRYLSTGGDVFSYLVEGDDAFNKTYGIKNDERKRCSKGNCETQIVRNVAHVPDPPDFGISLDILFKDGLTFGSLEESKAI